MTFAERLMRYLPAFMRPGGPVTEAVTEAMGDAMQELVDEARLLRGRGAANRFASEFGSYYAGTSRYDDVARLGMSRLLSKRSGESWADYETRVGAFVGLEVWDGTRIAYTALGDVSQWGTMTGIEREIERTGLEAEIYALANDGWKLRDFVGGEPADPLDSSKMYEIGEEVPEGQRTTKLYDIGYVEWTFCVVLTNPDVVDYREGEVEDIIRQVKPAWCLCLLQYPGETTWVEVE